MDSSVTFPAIFNLLRPLNDSFGKAIYHHANKSLFSCKNYAYGFSYQPSPERKEHGGTWRELTK
jgi:hypothetical protein